MIDEIVNAFHNHSSTRGTSIHRIKYYNPENIILQHIPIKEKGGKVEVHGLRNGNITDTLTGADNEGIVKSGGKVINIHEGIRLKEVFTMPLV